MTQKKLFRQITHDNIRARNMTYTDTRERLFGLLCKQKQPQMKFSLFTHLAITMQYALLLCLCGTQLRYIIL